MLGDQDLMEKLFDNARDLARLNIEIIDTGIGIPMDETSKIGKEMFRGVKVKANTNGTGLSLLLVKKVLDLTGGKMSFKTEEGKGSGFEINLK